MGLPTGVEVKTEPVTAEETTVAAAEEDTKPVIVSAEIAAAAVSAIATTPPVGPAAAAEGTASADTAETVEVQNSSQIEASCYFFVLFYNGSNSCIIYSLYLY